jgi:hypothetical protein
MPDLTNHLLRRLQDNKLPGSELNENFIAPKYDDQSILNIPSTICEWMGIPGISEGLLHPDIRLPLGKGVRRVLLILMDALSLHRLQEWMDSTPVWQTLVEDGVLAPLTSVVPSTTSSAITTFWTGKSPAVHGVIGYEMWLKEYSVVANMILHAPMTFRGDVGSLERAGFSPEGFLPTSTFGSHLVNHGVKPYAFNHHSIARSGLSRTFLRDAEIMPFATPASMWVGIRQLFESRPDEKMYVWAYWSAVDGLSHYHGPDDDRVSAEFSHYSAAFEQFFLNRLSPAARKDTLIILTADHGMAHTPLNPIHVLRNHPQLHQHLLINPTCENRFASLYLRPGREDAVRDYFEAIWPNKFTIITQDQALDAGLFGPGPHHPHLRDRIGDLIVVARDDSYLWWSDSEDFLLGRHGGLAPQDMLVPFLATRM